MAILGRIACGIAAFSSLLIGRPAAWSQDPIRDLQEAAVESGAADWGYWGARKDKFVTWRNHSNRLIPIYTFGIALDRFTADQSVYRVGPGLKKLYGKIPDGTLNESATYADQTDIWHLQVVAAEDLKKRFLFLVVFDGMDWTVSRCAAIAKAGKVQYKDGRGTGLTFQDYRGTKTDFGFMVTSPHNHGTRTDVDKQVVKNAGGRVSGGYSPKLGGDSPWSTVGNDAYRIGQDDDLPHAVTDSAASATSMTSGIKTYNGAINVSAEGVQVEPIGRWLQRERGFSIGVVTSVPISHATPAAAYANNVSRADYQDLTRDLVGLASVAHPDPLPGVDVLLGCGWGEEKSEDSDQGENFVAGNRYLSPDDLSSIDADQGGKYIVAQRTPGRLGREVLIRATEKAIQQEKRLLGIFGENGHLPYRTADGRFNSLDESYPDRTVEESPRLVEMTRSAIRVLEAKSDRFWLMVEAGDVDWACHANNIDDAIGAVHDGDEAVGAIFAWIDQRKAWDDSAVMVTADHGHYLVLNRPGALAEGQPQSSATP